MKRLKYDVHTILDFGKGEVFDGDILNLAPDSFLVSIERNSPAFTSSKVFTAKFMLVAKPKQSPLRPKLSA